MSRQRSCQACAVGTCAKLQLDPIIIKSKIKMPFIRSGYGFLKWVLSLRVFGCGFVKWVLLLRVLTTGKPIHSTLTFLWFHIRHVRLLMAWRQCIYNHQVNQYHTLNQYAVIAKCRMDLLTHNMDEGHIIICITYWGRVTHICVDNLTSIGSDNGLLPGRHQAIIRTNDGLLLIGPVWTNLSEILIEIHTFSFKKMHLKMSPAKWRPFCLGLNVIMLHIWAKQMKLQQVNLFPSHKPNQIGKSAWICYSKEYVTALLMKQ